MATYKLKVKRTETYIGWVDIEADSEEEAKRTTQSTLDDEGWDAVFDDDGEYCECFSEVEKVTEVKHDIPPT